MEDEDARGVDEDADNVDDEEDDTGDAATHNALRDADGKDE
jgi:hypothetical protein